MARRLGLRVPATLVLLSALLLAVGVGGASAQGQFHGVAFLKACEPNTSVGSPSTCPYQIQNNTDQGQDTLQVTGLTDVVHSAGGDVSSGNILGALQLVFSGPTVTCS